MTRRFNEAATSWFGPPNTSNTRWPFRVAAAAFSAASLYIAGDLAMRADNLILAACFSVLGIQLAVASLTGRWFNIPNTFRKLD